jgi:hypothetical protein
MAGIISRNVAASGIVLPDPGIVAKSVAGTIVPPLPRKGFGGRLGAIYGNATAGGRLKLYDGVSAAAPALLIADIPIGTGNVAIEPVSATWRFVYGVYAEFSGGLAGNLSLQFV